MRPFSDVKHLKDSEYAARFGLDSSAKFCVFGRILCCNVYYCSLGSDKTGVRCLLEGFGQEEYESDVRFPIWVAGTTNSGPHFFFFCFVGFLRYGNVAYEANVSEYFFLMFLLSLYVFHIVKLIILNAAALLDALYTIHTVLSFST